MFTMAVVLTPILKPSSSEKLNNSSSSSRVTFNLPEEMNVIEYLKNEDAYTSYSMKLNNLIKRITDPNTENELLLRWIQDFQDNILFLENNERIVFTLLNLRWFAKDDKFVKAYQDFILSVVTAHPSFIKHVLGSILKVFYTVHDSSSEEINDVEERNFQNGHSLLKNVIILIPSCENHLCSLLSEKFPYMKQATKMLYCYVQNLLHLSSYLPSRRLTILECILEKMIHIDVNCSRSALEMSETMHEDENMLVDQNICMEECIQKKMTDPLAHTLDVLIGAVFQYIHKSCFLNDDVQLDWEATKKLYKEFLTAFDKIILPTHGSCHAQYIMFYICSFKAELSEGFLDYLWKKVQNPAVGPVYRQLSAFYMGSFLARAKYINISTVKACLDLMCQWIHSYIDNHTSQDLNVHGTFHSVCQTVFYVFAFRSQDLLEADKGMKFLRTLNFDRIVTCRLNPLRYCDRTIVQNFANIARNCQIVYVYPVIEKNNRNLIYLSSEKKADLSAGSMIQTFFPFDPYLLIRSKKWIEPNYRVYSHCQKVDESMDTSDEEETNVPDSLFTYGTSPGFKKFLLK